MSENTRISVIVPVYKVGEYLPKCVGSIRNQTHSDLEIILVDDGSPDDCGAICDAFALQDPRIKVVHKENGGLSSARNAGIDASSGEYLAFVDGDDWIEPEMYAHLLERMIHYNVKLGCCGRYDVDGETGEKKVGLCFRKEEKVSGEELVRRIFTWDNCDSSACDKLYHRSLFADHRYPMGKVCEDVPVTYLIALKAGEAVLCDRPFYNYFHRAGSITMASVSEKMFHYSQHTAEIYPYICRNHPSVVPQAQYLRVRSLVYNIITLDLAGKEYRQKFAREYQHSQAELWKHLGFLLTSPMFGKQERLTDLMLMLGCYRPFRKVYHLLKPHKKK